MWKEKLTPKSIDQYLKKIDKQKFQNNVESIEEIPHEEAKQYSLDIEFQTGENSLTSNTKSVERDSQKSEQENSLKKFYIEQNLQLNENQKQNFEESPKIQNKKTELDHPSLSFNLKKVKKKQNKLNKSQEKSDKIKIKSSKRNKTPQPDINSFIKASKQLVKSANFSDLQQKSKLLKKPKKTTKKKQGKSNQFALKIPKTIYVDGSFINSARSRISKKIF